jgi:predicted NAD/FAD-dependent oxidoreductase
MSAKASQQGTSKNNNKTGGGAAGAHMLYTVDHASQYFTVSDPRFQSLVEHWLQQGVCKAWGGRFGTISTTSQGGAVTFKKDDNMHPYVGTTGMQHLCDTLAAGVTVQQPVWVGRVEQKSNKWQVQARIYKRQIP